MSAKFISRRDLDFLVFDWLDAGQLFERQRFREHSREASMAILDLAYRVSQDEFLPHYKIDDREEPRLEADGVRVHPAVKRAVLEFAGAGLNAGPFDAELGGHQLPELIHAAVMANCQAANIGAAAYPMLSIANARLIAKFGTHAQIQAFARPQIEGLALGTMCLSEPQAGSSLAEITTRATGSGEDELGSRFRLTGSKMWISGGDHDITENIFHLVLAKIPDQYGHLPRGTKGLSLFVVPKFLGAIGKSRRRNDIAVAGLNHKMGYRATSNCLLNFGEGSVHRPFGHAGAVGYLIGEPNSGLSIMFHMMNEARIAVGLGAAAVSYRSHLLSVAYAAERVQGRIYGSEGGDPVSIIHHADVRRMLAVQKVYAEGALALVFYCARLVDDWNTAPTDDARAEAKDCLDILTPVAKTWPSECGLTACDIAIQIHGGYGYTRDFDVEQLYRDNRLNRIHEGTTGIQALDLLGRKIRRGGSKNLAALDLRISATIDAASQNGFAEMGALLEKTWKAVSEAAKAVGARSEAEVAWHATSYLEAFGHTVVGWLWLNQALRAQHCLRVGASDRRFFEAKIQSCRCFMEFEMPKVELWLKAVANNSDAAAMFPISYFSGGD